MTIADFYKELHDRYEAVFSEAIAEELRKGYRYSDYGGRIFPAYIPLWIGEKPTSPDDTDGLI